MMLENKMPFNTGDNNTAALCSGGETPSYTGNTELWNGTSWSEQNNLNTSRASAGAGGSSASTFAFGGATPSATGAAEEWSTTQPVGAWATSTSINTARNSVFQQENQQKPLYCLVEINHHLQLIQKYGMELLGLKLIICLQQEMVLQVMGHPHLL